MKTSQLDYLHRWHVSSMISNLSCVLQLRYVFRNCNTIIKTKHIKTKMSNYVSTFVITTSFRFKESVVAGLFEMMGNEVEVSAVLIE